jgi:hypothetical protein
MSSTTASERRLESDARLARKSTRGRHVLAEHSGHWIPLDAPQTVIHAITGLVHELRSSGFQGG